MNSKRKALESAVDKLISKHGSTSPELLQDLLQLQKELRDAADGKRPLDYAMTALRVASWVKWVFDHLPPH